MSSACASPQPPRPPGAALAPGFRFHPTDEELVGYYLKRKVSGRPLRVDAIAEVDIYRAEPWDLPGKSRIQCRDTEWYFFCTLDRKYASRSRTNRATGSGYWKTTGKDRPVFRGGRAIGMKKTLVFHAGRAPRGERTNWVMHEYRLQDEELARTGTPLDAFVVCRIFQKRGLGPQNGAQYGASFVEEEWEDDGFPVFNEGFGHDALIVVNNPEIPEMDDEEENKDRGLHDKNAAHLGEPNGQVELSNFVDPVSLVKMCQAHGLSDAMDGSTGVPGLQNENLDAMGGYGGPADPNRSLVALNDGYLELNDFAYAMGSNCQECVACPEGICHDEHFVNCEITCSQELNNVKEYFRPNDENNFPEQFLLSETGEENCYVELDDLLGPKPDDSSSGGPADDGLAYFDAPNHYVHADQGLSSGINSFIDATMANLSEPDLMDELIAYFDATENMQPYDQKFESGTSTSNQPNPAPVVNGDIVDVPPTSPQQFKAVGNCSTSSLLTPDAGKQSSSKSVDSHGEPDVQFDDSCDKALSKRLVSMLDTISPPPAFAAEYPTKGPHSVEHRSVALSSRLTAGMIQIHGMTMSGNGKNWFLQKNVDSGFVLSHGLTRNDVTGSMGALERMPKMTGGITVFILRNSFHLLFLFVLFLAASFKVGVYVYTR